MGKFDGQVVMITGAARGQGRSHAVAFAKEGADLVLFDALEQIDTVPYPLATGEDMIKTVRLVEELDHRCLSIKGDVRESQAINDAVSATLAEFGRLDVMVANAGIYAGGGPFHKFSDQQWQDVLDIDLTGVFKAFRAAIGPMREQKHGRLLATSSMAARTGLMNLAHYCAAKWGILGLVKTVAQEVAEDGITVNAVLPGNVETELFRNEYTYKMFRPDLAHPTAEDVGEMFKALHAIPIAALDPVEISRAMIFLASDEASYITGEALHVAAGWNARNSA
jgi:SDR family mycofactocin-dependent oxidoreductase